VRALQTVPRVVMLQNSRHASSASGGGVAHGRPVATSSARVTLSAAASGRSVGSAADERAALGATGPIMVSLTPESYFSQVATGAAIGLTEAPIAEVYSPAGIRFVPVRDLAPSVRAVGHRQDDDRPEVRAMVATICAVAEVEPRTGAC
jgi:hypothetical protein